MSTEAEYGSWKSPISSHLVTSAVNVIAESPVIDPVTGYVFWCEQLSSEEGRNAVFHFNPDSGEVVRWTPKGYDVRTRVHEYGGGAFTVYNNTVYFSHALDDALYRQKGNQGTPVRLTKVDKRRYANGVYWPKMKGVVLVCEDHTASEDKEATTTLVLVDEESGTETTLAQHSDFYASPAISPCGNRIAWVQWQHPQMPWDDTKICVGEVNEGGQVKVIYTQQTGSMMTPTFGPAGDLFYIHDKTGWWNLYHLTDLKEEVNLTPEHREVGWPMWQFGNCAYALNPAKKEKVAYISGDELRILDVNTRKSHTLDTGYNVYTRGLTYSKDGNTVYVLAGDGGRNRRVIKVDPVTGQVGSVNNAPPLPIDLGYISIPKHIEFKTAQDEVAYGYLYLPENRDYHGPITSKPPLLVRVHGGPTGATIPVLNLEYQFFTSRGFAILDVNYRGSTGYGTQYRNKLIEKWGVLDVEDTDAGARHLVREGLVDGARICIDGWSAGGFTTMAVLSIPDSPFSAGASHYGVSDMEKLAMDTHKFESRYMDSMIGPLPAQKARYDARSPLLNCQKLNKPMIFFQGSEDKIVLPSQAREMYDVVKNKGLPTAFVLYQGEYHGFVKPDNLRSALEAEMFFYSKVFGFTLADVESKVEIENLTGWKVGQQWKQ